MQPGVRMANLSLRDLTKSALVEILSGQCGSGGELSGNIYGDSVATASHHEWSVLIFDNFARDLIAPILKVGELRKLGVTLYLKVESTREPVQDAPAVYLCQPTEDNIRRIAQDVIAEKYKSFNINWATPIDRKMLEYFATELQPAQHISTVNVKDRFMSFVSPERDLFSLQMPDSYYTIASGHTTDAQRDEYFKFIANGILHVLLTLQVVPIIASVESAVPLAEKVTEAIQVALRDHTLSQSPDVTRPVLLLCERTTDLIAPLIQPSTYRALLHDTLNMRLNKVSIGTPATDYEMEEGDPWWSELATSELYDTIEAIAKDAVTAEQQEKAQKAELKNDDVQASTEAMFRVMEGNQAASEKKRYLKTHSALTTELSEAMLKGELHKFNNTAEEMLYEKKFDNDTIKGLVKGKNSVEARVRLALLHRLLIDEDDSSATEFSKDLEANLIRNAAPSGATEGDTLSASAPQAASSVPPHLAFSYVKSCLKHFKQQRSSRSYTSSAPNKAAQNIKNLFQTSHAFMMKAVQGSDKRMFPHTKLVDAVLQTPKKSEEQERNAILSELAYCIDPKTNGTVQIGSYDFDSALMFVLGGGNYLEYEDIKSWEAKEQNAGKHVVYGVTELLTGNSFLKQLSHLGQEYP